MFNESLSFFLHFRAYGYLVFIGSITTFCLWRLIFFTTNLAFHSYVWRTSLIGVLFLVVFLA